MQTLMFLMRRKLDMKNTNHHHHHRKSHLIKQPTHQRFLFQSNDG